MIQSQSIQWGLALFFYFLYSGKYPIFEQWRAKSTADEQWPWESNDAETWRRMFRRSVMFTCLNSMVVILILAYFIDKFGLYPPNPTDIDKMPSVPVFIAQMIFCCLVEDACFYCSHRLLHHPALYPHIHKIHHENKVVYCLAAIHSHPIEYVFGNILPLMMGPGLLWHRMHRAAVFGWYLIRGVETIDAHCGYSFPWCPFRLLPF